MGADSKTRQSISSSNGVANPLNENVAASSKEAEVEKPVPISEVDNSPSTKSLTEATGLAEPAMPSREGDLEGNKVAVLQDESKLLHGRESNPYAVYKSPYNRASLH